MWMSSVIWKPVSLFLDQQKYQLIKNMETFTLKMSNVSENVQMFR